ncbi:MAG: HAMP domain-containing histidine kinase [Clostridia bacterium]|nr:HAMP domain-containing histidine kinase [Clostridia bacterium]
MLSERSRKRRKLAHEILVIFAVCFIISLLLFLVLMLVGVGLVEQYCFDNDIPLDEDQLFRLDSTALSLSLSVAVIFFVVLFLILFGDRLSYTVKTISDGISALQRGEHGYKVELIGNNELTQLAESINYLSETEQRVKAKEKALNEEKEELIRSLSHDIRTPLTSIMSYTELVSGKEDELSSGELREYLELVRRKSAQIKELTDILLDGGRRNVELFEDGRLLVEQLVSELEEALEDDFRIDTDFTHLPAFSGSFDLRELQRVFDNLVSNIKKYADPASAVMLSAFKNESGLVIRQKNAVKQDVEKKESYRMGISSIRRIAHNYGGSVNVKEENGEFEIAIFFSVI